MLTAVYALPWHEARSGLSVRRAFSGFRPGHTDFDSERGKSPSACGHFPLLLGHTGSDSAWRTVRFIRSTFRSAGRRAHAAQVLQSADPQHAGSGFCIGPRLRYASGAARRAGIYEHRARRMFCTFSEKTRLLPQARRLEFCFIRCCTKYPAAEGAGAPVRRGGHLCI